MTKEKAAERIIKLIENFKFEWQQEEGRDFPQVVFHDDDWARVVIGSRTLEDGKIIAVCTVNQVYKEFDLTDKQIDALVEQFIRAKYLMGCINFLSGLYIDDIGDQLKAAANILSSNLYLSGVYIDPNAVSDEDIEELSNTDGQPG